MGTIKEGLVSPGGIISNGASRLAQMKWIFIVVIILATLIGVIYYLSIARKKKAQWTHKFRVKRTTGDRKLTPEIIIRARRFPVEKGVEVFELEKPILGSYLCPQPGEYSGVNEFSIILDKHNRIYLNKGERFDRDSQSLQVSAVHAGIDVTLQNMKEKWHQAHKVDKRITTAELIKAGLKALGIVALVIIGIVAIQQWGDAQQYKAQQEQAKAEVMKNLGEAISTMEKVVNTQQLEITPMIKALYGTENIANEINKYRSEETNAN